MPNIRLQASDGEEFEVDAEVAKCSDTIKTLLDNLGMEEDDGAAVPLSNVDSAILKKIIDWIIYHKHDPAPEVDETKALTTDIQQWDLDFLGSDTELLWNLIRASNYLDIKGLLEVTCKHAANLIKGKTPDEIRKTFNVPVKQEATD